MSEHLESSSSVSMDQNIQVHANHEGENELYIPYWDEEGSSSTHLNHLMEEVRILKNKCAHLENHLEENHREFSSLNELYLVAQTNERKLLKENEEIRKRYRQISGQLTQVKTELSSAVAELNLSSKKDLEWRENISKMRQREAGLEQQINNLHEENDFLRRKAALAAAQGQDEVSKQLEDQRMQLDLKWKAKQEELEKEKSQLEKELQKYSRDLNQAKQQGANARQRLQQLCSQLQGQLELSKEQVQRGKATAGNLQRQLKDLKGVLEDVSSKNDEYERQNNDLQFKLTEEAGKAKKMSKRIKELEGSELELREQFQQLERDYRQLQITHKNMRGKCTMQEKQIQQLSSSGQLAQQSIAYLESLKATLRQEVQRQKILRESQVQKILEANEQRTNHFKKAYQEEKEGLETQVAQLEAHVRKLNEKIKGLKETSEGQEAKIELEAERKRLKELQERQPPQCDHLVQIRKDKETITALTFEKEHLRASLEEQQLIVENLRKDAISAADKSKKQLQTIRDLETDAINCNQRNEELLTEKARLQLKIQKMIQSRKSEEHRLAEYTLTQAERGAFQEQFQGQAVLIASLQQQLRSRGSERSETGAKKEQQPLGMPAHQSAEQTKALRQSIERDHLEFSSKIKQMEALLEAKQREISDKNDSISQLKKDIANRDDRCRELVAEIQRHKETIDSLASKAQPSPKSNAENIKQRGKDSQQIEPIINSKKSNPQQDEDSALVEELESEYQRELQALRRLIGYRGGKEEQRRIEELKGEFEAKMETLLRDYEKMQSQMLLVRRSLISDYEVTGAGSEDYTLELEAWRIRVDQLLSEKSILVERVSLWESKFEQLRCLFEAKLESKEETINLLLLKISNLEMASNQCACLPAAYPL